MITKNKTTTCMKDEYWIEVLILIIPQNMHLKHFNCIKTRLKGFLRYFSKTFRFTTTLKKHEIS